MITDPFQGLKFVAASPPRIRRRYSVTSDVVAYRRCPRQYGAFRIHDYAPAHQTQIYFGTVVHQVLDRCHQYFSGQIDPTNQGRLPDEGNVLSFKEIDTWFSELEQDIAIQPPSDILRFLLEVENGLRSRGIRPVQPQLRRRVAVILQNFNALEGPKLYPRVIDTEHRLQADRESHVLHGVIDLLLDPSQGDDGPSSHEMWDYKGVSVTELEKKDLETYRFQMRVYARLYELKHGVLPRRALLYFVNELYNDRVPVERPVNAILEVSLEPNKVDEAISEFTATVEAIEAARRTETWPPAEVGEISDSDCTICDLRWDCPTPNDGRGVSLRYP